MHYVLANPLPVPRAYRACYETALVLPCRTAHAFLVRRTARAASEADAQRHQELFPEEYPWQQQTLPPLHGAALAAGHGLGGGIGGSTWQASGGGGGAGGGAGGLEAGNFTVGVWEVGCV